MRAFASGQQPERALVCSGAMAPVLQHDLRTSGVSACGPPLWAWIEAGLDRSRSDVPRALADWVRGVDRMRLSSSVHVGAMTEGIVEGQRMFTAMRFFLSVWRRKTIAPRRCRRFRAAPFPTSGYMPGVPTV